MPGLGPRTAGELWRQAGIGTIDALEAAARAGELRELRGMTARTEQKLLDGIRTMRARPARRMRLGEGHLDLLYLGPIERLAAILFRQERVGLQINGPPSVRI